MEAEFIEIEFLNWEKYNPRNDVKFPSWFRFQNRLIESPEFHAWPGEHIKALCYLFSQASQKASAEIRVFPEHAFRVCMIKEKDMRETLQKLVFLKVIILRDTHTVRGRDADDTHLHATLQDKTGQDTTEQDMTPPRRKARTPSLGGLPTSLPEFASLSEVIRDRGITEGVQKSWLEAFPEPAWIVSEVRKALAWEMANPSRKKKRFSAFMTNWMTRGWDGRRALPATNGNGSSWAEKRDASNNAVLQSYLSKLGEKS